MRRTLGISTELLPSNLRKQFDAVFAVAQTHSITDWRIVPLSEADVICAVHGEAAMTAGLRRDQLKIWLAPRAFTAELAKYGNIVLCPDEIRVANVLATVDMAALRLMDETIYPHLNRTTAETRSENGGSRRSLDLDDASTRYSLSYWPTMRPPFNRRPHLDAIAMLAKRPMTAYELASKTELSRADAAALFDELARRRALKAVSRVEPPRKAAASLRGAVQLVGAGGLLGQLRSWLGRGRVANGT